MEKELITILVKKPSKKGDQYYFNIPIEFIRTGKIDPEKDYELQIFSLVQE
jgi:hypothetical protein